MAKYMSKRGVEFYSDPTAFHAIRHFEESSRDATSASDEERRLKDFDNFSSLDPDVQLRLLNGRPGDRFSDAVRSSLAYEARKQKKAARRRQGR